MTEKYSSLHPKIFVIIEAFGTMLLVSPQALFTTTNDDQYLWVFFTFSHHSNSLKHFSSDIRSYS